MLLLNPVLLAVKTTNIPLMMVVLSIAMPPVIISKVNSNLPITNFRKMVASHLVLVPIVLIIIPSQQMEDYIQKHMVPKLEMHYLMANLVTLIQLKTKLVFLHLAILHAKQPK